MNRPTNQSNSTDIKEKVERLKGLLDNHALKGPGLVQIISIFRKDYIEPIFHGLQRDTFDSETASLAEDIIEGITSKSMTAIAYGISSIGNMVVSGGPEGDKRIPEDVTAGLGFLLEELGCLISEIHTIEYDIALSLAWRLKKELKEKEQLVEVSALKD